MFFDMSGLSLRKYIQVENMLRELSHQHMKSWRIYIFVVVRRQDILSLYPHWNYSLHCRFHGSHHRQMF